MRFISKQHACMHRPHMDLTILHHLAAAAPPVHLFCEVVHMLIAWVLPAASHFAACLHLY